MCLSEGAGRAPWVCATSEIEGGSRVHALRGRGVRVFEMRCARGTISDGKGRGRKVAEENEGFARTEVLAKWRF